LRAIGDLLKGLRVASIDHNRNHSSSNETEVEIRLRRLQVGPAATK
jgi:hypothetical protein